MCALWVSESGKKWMCVSLRSFTQTISVKVEHVKEARDLVLMCCALPPFDHLQKRLKANLSFGICGEHCDEL